MKKIVIFFIAFTSFLVVFSQTFEVPKDYKLVAKEDYEPYEKQVIECINWLAEVPVNEQDEKQKEANSFLLKWVSRSPYVHVEIGSDIVNFSKPTPQLLMIFLGGWVKYSLETRNFDDKLNGNLAGIEAVIEYYIKNKQIISKNSNVEKYIKMKEKGTLKENIEKKIKK